MLIDWLTLRVGTLTDERPGRYRGIAKDRYLHVFVLGVGILRRLHAALAAAAERGPADFSELLLTPGVGARTVAALALVAEVIHGAPSRFSDPARFSMAHGGKDGHPFPVPLRVYDQTIRVLKQAVASARLGNDDKLAAITRLDAQARWLERVIDAGPDFETLMADEQSRSPQYGGRTVFGPAGG
jgi:uncharacterized protein